MGGSRPQGRGALARASRPRGAARRRGRGPRANAARVDPSRLGGHEHRGGRRRHLPDEHRLGERVHPRPFRSSAGVRRGRRAARQARVDPGRAPSASRGARLRAALGAGGGGPRSREFESRRARSRGAGDRRGRSRNADLHVRHDRAAERLHAHAQEPRHRGGPCAHEHAGRRRHRPSLSSARAHVRSSRAPGRRLLRLDGRARLGSDTRRGGARRCAADDPAGSAAHLREDPRRRPRPDRERGGRKAEARPLGAGRRRARVASAQSGRAGPCWARESRSASPTGSSSRR